METKSCKNCAKSFELLDEDFEFLKKFEVPAPTHCPDCRFQRRFAVRNQNKLYNRICDFSGEKIISLYSQDKGYKVYKEEHWWGDGWDSVDYGQDFDFNRPFFEQFNELMRKVPRRAMHQDGSNENSEYTTFGFNNKNTYLLFACFHCEDSFYSTFIGFCKDSADCLRCTNSEMIYGCIDCDKCYDCAFCLNSSECQNSYLLDDCRNCKNCIACKNLRNKEYYIYNQQVTKEEFLNFKSKLLESGFDDEIKKFNEWKLKIPTIYSHIKNSENCDGDYIENSINCHNCFDMIMGAQDCKNCQYAGWKGKDLQDCSMAGKESELLYEMGATITTHNSAFGNFCRMCSNIFYCESISSCSNCFGCIGLRHKEYCILNKQYTKEEYFDLRARIIEHMKKTGEWGEFFPVSISPFGYNETLAQELFPLTKEDASAKGYKWKEEENEKQEGSSSLVCSNCKKDFKVIPQELNLYKKMGLVPPKDCWKCRHEKRLGMRNPYKLWKRNCFKCGTEIQTSYSPDRPEIVYCESCYLAEVY